MSDENKESKEITKNPSSRSMRSGFESLFDTFQNDFDDMMDFWWPLTPTRRTSKTASRVAFPMLDIEDKGTHYELKADLPGVPKDSVDLNVTEGAIEISGEQAEEKKETENNYLLRERRWASFNRRFSFPEEVIPKEADAKMKDGILHVNVPKKEPKKEKVHKIKIK
jgi:HSP20 family protein